MGTDPDLRRALDIANQRGVEIIQLRVERGLPIEVHDISCGPVKFHPRMLTDKHGPPTFICPKCKSPSDAIYVDHPDDGRQRRMRIETFVETFQNLPMSSFPFDHDAWDKMVERLGLDEADKAAEEAADRRFPGHTATDFANRLVFMSFGEEPREDVWQVTFEAARGTLAPGTGVPWWRATQPHARKSLVPVLLVVFGLLLSVIVAFFTALAVFMVRA